MVRFTPELARWEPELFVETVLIDWLRVAEVWVGANFLFGRDRSGTFTLLRALGDDRGFRVEKIEPVRYKDFVVSSTRVRHLSPKAGWTRPARCSGTTTSSTGRSCTAMARGRELGFPTANLETDNELLRRPASTPRWRDRGRPHPAVTSVGVRPTIGDGRLTVETFLLDGRHDLYGERLRLASSSGCARRQVRRPRAALEAQIARDCADAARFWAGSASSRCEVRSGRMHRTPHRHCTC